MKDVLSARTLTDTVAVAANPAPAPKPQSKKPRTTSRIVSRTDVSRYDGRGYDRYLDEPRYGYTRAPLRFEGIVRMVIAATPFDLRWRPVFGLI